MEKGLPKFLSRVKETGNNFKIQVGSLKWIEDKSAEPNTHNENAKQPKIYLSNSIISVPCKENSIAPCSKGAKTLCVKSISHFQYIFEFTALLFANINNMSRNLLYIKLNLEKFGMVINDLKNLISIKCAYYKNPTEVLRQKVGNEKIYRIVSKLKKLEVALTEESEKLKTYANHLPSQVLLSRFTCIPLHSQMIVPDKDKFISSLNLILSQISYIAKFIRMLVNNKKGFNLSSSQALHKGSFIESFSHSFIFQIFHIRSILLKKLQPYSISMHLQNATTSLLSCLRETTDLSSSKINGLGCCKFHIFHDNKFHSSNSPGKQGTHSYNSSWDMITEENYQRVDEVLETDSSDSSSLSELSPIDLVKKTTEEIKNTEERKKSQAPTIRIRKTKFYESIYGNSEQNIMRLPSVQSSRTQFNRTYTLATSSSENKRKYDFTKEIKKIKSGTNGFLSHRIKRIQNNKSISPLTKIEYIRQEFENQLLPTGVQLKSSFLKFPGKSTYLYTMR